MSLYLGTQLLAGVATNTTSNDLLDFKWTDHELTDQSWLRADTFSWQSGTFYTDAYNHLVADYNTATAQWTTETIGSYTIWYLEANDGHKIIFPESEATATNIYNESGVAWYYILDTANQRFKLPRELPITDKSKGNGMTLGVNDGTNDVGLYSQSGDYARFVGNTSLLGTNVGTSTSGEGNMQRNKSLGITTDQTKSGIISHRANTNGQQYLYFYVGQFSQSATEQTAGLNSSLFNGKVDLDLSNANKYNLTTYAFENIQNTDSSKVGYVYQVSATNTSAIAPAGGKWLVLCSYIVRNSDGVALNLSANVLHFSGEIIDGGTTVIGNATNFTTIVGLLKIQ